MRTMKTCRRMIASSTSKASGASLGLYTLKNQVPLGHPISTALCFQTAEMYKGSVCSSKCHIAIGRCGTLGKDRNVFLGETLQKKRTRVRCKKMLSSLASLGSTRHIQKRSGPSHAFRSLWPRSCRSPTLLWQLEVLLRSCAPQPSATRPLWTRRCSRLGYIRSPQRRSVNAGAMPSLIIGDAMTDKSLTMDGQGTQEDAKRVGEHTLESMSAAADAFVSRFCKDTVAAPDQAKHSESSP